MVRRGCCVFRRRVPVLVWVLGGVLLLLPLAGPRPRVGAQSSLLQLSASVQPTIVQAGGRVAYTLVVQHSGSSEVLGLQLTDTLPAGFGYVSGSTQVLLNDTLISTQNPSITGRSLTWSGLTLPAARTGSVYGMHTFVQDRCDSSYIAYQLDRVRQLMGANSYAKQLFYGITAQSQNPSACWVDFVNACYDRDLIPVVRLQGQYGGPNWIKPAAAAPGDYTQIAQAYARVVAGLPRRSNRRLYVEIWNEPNLDIEWSGQSNPVEYAHFLVDVAAAIRGLGDSRIVILNGGLSPGGNYNHLGFIDAMAGVPGAMQAFDVWAAHPYPGNHPPEYNIHDGTAPVYPELTIDGYLLELARLAARGRKGVSVLLTETGYALGQNNFTFQGYAPIDENNRADYIARAFRDYWRYWPELLGVCPYELVDPYGNWGVWDWLYPDGRRHLQYDAVAALNKTPALVKSELTVRFEAQAATTAGTHTSTVQASSANAGSSTLANAAPVQVAPPAATPTPTRTPTAVPTATPSATPTPLVVPYCYPALRNGGFEQDSDWEIPDTAYPAAYSQAVVRSGTRSMRVGIVGDASSYSYSSARQAFYIPLAAPVARISFWYYPISGDTDHGRQYVLLLDQDKQYVETVMWISSNAGQWQLWEHDLVGHGGETLWLHLGVQNDGQGGATGIYFDDANVRVCGAVGIAEPSSSAWVPLIWKGPRPGTQALGAAGAQEPELPLASLQTDTALPKRPLGLTALSAPAELAAMVEPSASVQALELDPEHQRLVFAMQDQVVSLDAFSGRFLYAHTLPAAVTALAVDPLSGEVYAAVPSEGSVCVLAPDATVRGCITDLGRPTSISIGPGFIYVTDPGQGRVMALNAESWAALALKTLPAAPHGLVYDGSRHRLYVGQMGVGTILALDANTLEPVAEVALGGLGYPLDLALDATGERLYVAHALSPRYGAVSVIDTSKMVLLATRWGNQEQTLFGAGSVCVDAKRGVVYLGIANGIAALDAIDLSVLNVTPLPRSAWTGTMAIDPLESTVYIAGERSRLWSWQSVLPQGSGP